MKIVTLMGSPRSKGSTAAVLGRFEGRVSSEHEVIHYDVPQLDFVGCRGCYACAAVDDEPGCAQADDATAVLKDIVSADVVVYATPLYMWGVASDLRALMERHFCLVKNYGSPARKSLVYGKRIALLVTSGGPVEGNCDLIQEAFDRFAAYVEADTVSKYMLPGSSGADALEGRADDLAERMVRELTG